MRLPKCFQCQIKVSCLAEYCHFSQRVSQLVHSEVALHLEMHLLCSSLFLLCLKNLIFLQQSVIVASHSTGSGLLLGCCTLRVHSRMMSHSCRPCGDICILLFCTKISYCMSSIPQMQVCLIQLYFALIHLSSVPTRKGQ